MNRLGFLKTLGVAIACAPAVGRAALSPRTLWDWCRDFRDEHRLVRIDVGPDAMEHCRGGARTTLSLARSFVVFEAGARGRSMRFISEPYPWRLLPDGTVFTPFRFVVGDTDRTSSLNPEWRDAPHEAAIGYSLTTNEVFGAVFDRQTFQLANIQRLSA